MSLLTVSPKTILHDLTRGGPCDVHSVKINTNVFKVVDNRYCQSNFVFFLNFTSNWFLLYIE